jgi:hypothetical protein
MEELGWDSLDVRRKNQKLCLMYKIQKNIAPAYLTESCPPLVGAATAYNLRNAENISLPPGNKKGYTNSFFPSTVRLWNQLEQNIKGSPSIDSFKFNLKKKRCLKKNKLYSNYSGVRAINQTRMRLGLSGLKDQRRSYNHVDNSTCDFCGARKEDAMHYLLQCTTFAQPRVAFLDAIHELYLAKNINLDLSRTLVKKELVNNLLRGDKRFNDVENANLFEAVQRFIGESRRF